MAPICHGITYTLRLQSLHFPLILIARSNIKASVILSRVSTFTRIKTALIFAYTLAAVIMKALNESTVEGGAPDPGRLSFYE